MKKVISLVVLLMLILSAVSSAAPSETITKMTIPQFVEKYNDSIKPISQIDVGIKSYKLWHHTDGQDVYKCEAREMPDARMYICAVDGEIKQLLFITKTDGTYKDQDRIAYVIARSAVAMRALGVPQVEVYDKTEKCIKDEDGIVYMWSDQEDMLFMLAMDTREDEFNIHIVKGSYEIK